MQLTAGFTYGRYTHDELLDLWPKKCGNLGFYQYMNHWAAMRKALAGDAAKKFDGPGWAPNDKSPKPWLVEEPVTREETAKWFREGLDRAASLLNQRGRRVISLGQMQEMFFLVPKGTRELHYFWDGGSHKVLGPDHQVIAEVAVTDDIVKIPVPDGSDGRVWSLSPRAHRQLWFFNAPNVIAASPSALLVPREAVETGLLR